MSHKYQAGLVESIIHPKKIFHILGLDPYLLSPFAKKSTNFVTRKDGEFPSNITHVRSIYPHLAHFHGKCSYFFYVETLLKPTVRLPKIG